MSVGSGDGAAFGADPGLDDREECAGQSYSGPLAETVLMGNLAVRYPNRRLLWDGEKMEVTNDRDANGYARRRYRDGWAL
jgi:hypothetical protein